MRHTAQRGTLVLLLVLAAGACSSWFVEDGRDEPDEQQTRDDGGTERDADVLQSDAEVAACRTHTDCALVPAAPPLTGCCSCGATSLQATRAVTRAQADRERAACVGQAACQPCPPTTHDPLAPVIKAACMDHRCVAIDIRQDERSRCASDADCTLESSGCCPACGDDPSGYLSLRDDADTSLLACDPIPPCLPCAEQGKPRAFCAADGHCAVRTIERVGGIPSTTCYSPTQNRDAAETSSGTGCDCREEGVGICLLTFAKALRCQDGHWQALDDGHCTFQAR